MTKINKYINNLKINKYFIPNILDEFGVAYYLLLMLNTYYFCYSYAFALF